MGRSHSSNRGFLVHVRLFGRIIVSFDYHGQRLRASKHVVYPTGCRRESVLSEGHGGEIVAVLVELLWRTEPCFALVYSCSALSFLFGPEVIFCTNCHDPSSYTMIRFTEVAHMPFAGRTHTRFIFGCSCGGKGLAGVSPAATLPRSSMSRVSVEILTR